MSSSTPRPCLASTSHALCGALESTPRARREHGESTESTRDHPGRYARIYIGAGASVGTTAGVLALLQVGGVLVGPLGWPDGSQQLIRATRTSESSYAISPALAVQVCWPPCWRLGGGGVGLDGGGAGGRGGEIVTLSYALRMP